LLEQAEFVVFDLETTGLSAARCQICEFGRFACGRSSSSTPFKRL
jgi:DNA polymerase III alpha subunit (gram-positive type)